MCQALLGAFYMYDPYMCTLKEGIISPILQMKSQRLEEIQ